MKTKPVADILERAETWPPHVQDELAAYTRELEAGVNGDAYQPTPEGLPASIAGCGCGPVCQRG
jgi:hypothetical protein